VRRGDPAADGKAQAAAVGVVAGRIHAIAALALVRHVLRRDAAAGVAHFDDHPARLLPGRDGDDAVGRCRAGGVLQQVDEEAC
jgi:hypothetical protein